jgi:hypothetical protein
VALFTLWPPPAVGPNVGDNNNAVTLGSRFHVLTTAYGVGLTYWRGVASPGTKTGCVFLSGSPVAGTNVTFVDTGIEKFEIALFAAPVQFNVVVQYTAAVLFPQGTASFTANYWTSGPGSGGITQGPLHAPNSASAGGQGVFANGGTLTNPTSSFNGANYWISPIVSDTLDIGDLLAVGDSAAATMDRVRDVADILGLTDPITAAFDAVRTPADLFGLEDAAARTLDAHRTVGDQLVLGDGASAVITPAGAPGRRVRVGRPRTGWRFGPPTT